jgi:hexokinase
MPKMSQDKQANYIETKDIAYFTTLLETETRSDEREVLTRLLADVIAKRAARIAAVRRRKPK